jgi:hypothetical protein
MMSINSMSPVTSIAALRAYQQVKQHGEPTPSRAELQAQLANGQDVSTMNKVPNIPEQVSQLTSEEQIQQQQELERGWGLMSAVLGTQFDEYA